MKKESVIYRRQKMGSYEWGRAICKILRDSDLIPVKQDAKKMQRTDSEKP